MKIGATALHGFLGILEAKIKFLRSLLKNKVTTGVTDVCLEIL